MSYVWLHRVITVLNWDWDWHSEMEVRPKNLQQVEVCAPVAVVDDGNAAVVVVDVVVVVVEPVAGTPDFVRNTSSQLFFCPCSLRNKG